MNLASSLREHQDALAKTGQPLSQYSNSVEPGCDPNDAGWECGLCLRSIWYEDLVGDWYEDDNPPHDQFPHAPDCLYGQAVEARRSGRNG